MADTVFVIRYGFDYEHDNILGIYSSYYYANKAKKQFLNSEHFKQFNYHYVNIETFLMNVSVK